MTAGFHQRVRVADNLQDAIYCLSRAEDGLRRLGDVHAAVRIDQFTSWAAVVRDQIEDQIRQSSGEQQSATPDEAPTETVGPERSS